METKTLKREFHDVKTGLTFPEINPSFSPDEILDLLSNQHPHLTNAVVEGPNIESDKLVYKFVVSTGKKG